MGKTLRVEELSDDTISVILQAMLRTGGNVDAVYRETGITKSLIKQVFVKFKYRIKR